MTSTQDLHSWLVLGARVDVKSRHQGWQPGTVVHIDPVPPPLALVPTAASALPAPGPAAENRGNVGLTQTETSGAISSRTAETEASQLYLRDRGTSASALTTGGTQGYDGAVQAPVTPGWLAGAVTVRAEPLSHRSGAAGSTAGEGTGRQGQLYKINPNIARQRGWLAPLGTHTHTVPVSQVTAASAAASAAASFLPQAQYPTASPDGTVTGAGTGSGARMGMLHSSGTEGTDRETVPSSQALSTLASPERQAGLQTVAVMGGAGAAAAPQPSHPRAHPQAQGEEGETRPRTKSLLDRLFSGKLWGRKKQQAADDSRSSSAVAPEGAADHAADHASMGVETAAQPTASMFSGLRGRPTRGSAGQGTIYEVSEGGPSDSDGRTPPPLHAYPAQPALMLAHAQQGEPTGALQASARVSTTTSTASRPGGPPDPIRVREKGGGHGRDLSRGGPEEEEEADDFMHGQPLQGGPTPSSRMGRLRRDHHSASMYMLRTPSPIGRRRAKAARFVRAGEAVDVLYHAEGVSALAVPGDDDGGGAGSYTVGALGPGGIGRMALGPATDGYSGCPGPGSASHGAGSATVGAAASAGRNAGSGASAWLPGRVAELRGDLVRVQVYIPPPGIAQTTRTVAGWLVRLQQTTPVSPSEVLSPGHGGEEGQLKGQATVEKSGSAAGGSSAKSHRSTLAGLRALTASLTGGHRPVHGRGGSSSAASSGLHHAFAPHLEELWLHVNEVPLRLSRPAGMRSGVSGDELVFLWPPEPPEALEVAGSGTPVLIKEGRAQSGSTTGVQKRSSSSSPPKDTPATPLRSGRRSLPQRFWFGHEAALEKARAEREKDRAAGPHHAKRGSAYTDIVATPMAASVGAPGHLERAPPSRRGAGSVSGPFKAASVREDGSRPGSAGPGALVGTGPGMGVGTGAVIPPDFMAVMRPGLEVDVQVQEAVLPLTPAMADQGLEATGPLSGTAAACASGMGAGNTRASPSAALRTTQLTSVWRHAIVTKLHTDIELLVGIKSEDTIGEYSHFHTHASLPCLLPCMHPFPHLYSLLAGRHGFPVLPALLAIDVLFTHNGTCETIPMASGRIAPAGTHTGPSAGAECLAPAGPSLLAPGQWVDVVTLVPLSPLSGGAPVAASGRGMRAEWRRGRVVELNSEEVIVQYGLPEGTNAVLQHGPEAEATQGDLAMQGGGAHGNGEIRRGFHVEKISLKTDSFRLRPVLGERPLLLSSSQTGGRVGGPTITTPTTSGRLPPLQGPDQCPREAVLSPAIPVLLTSGTEAQTSDGSADLYLHPSPHSALCVPTDCSAADTLRWGADERAFRGALSADQWAIFNVQGDGNCLFRAIAHQLWADESQHDSLRAMVVAHMKVHAAFFEPIASAFGLPLATYVTRMARSGEWGGYAEILAVEEMCDRPVATFHSEDYLLKRSLKPRGVHFSGELSKDMEDSIVSAGPVTPIRVSYHGASHYNSVCASGKRLTGHPHGPTVGRDALVPPLGVRGTQEIKHARFVRLGMTTTSKGRWSLTSAPSSSTSGYSSGVSGAQALDGSTVQRTRAAAELASRERTEEVVRRHIRYATAASVDAARAMHARSASLLSVGTPVLPLCTDAEAPPRHPEGVPCSSVASASACFPAGQSSSGSSGGSMGSYIVDGHVMSAHESTGRLEEATGRAMGTGMDADAATTTGHTMPSKPSFARLSTIHTATLSNSTPGSGHAAKYRSPLASTVPTKAAPQKKGQADAAGGANRGPMARARGAERLAQKLTVAPDKPIDQSD